MAGAGRVADAGEQLTQAAGAAGLSRKVLDVAGGVPTPHKLKAVLVGGPSGGILPAEALVIERMRAPTGLPERAVPVDGTAGGTDA